MNDIKNKIKELLEKDFNDFMDSAKDLSVINPLFFPALTDLLKVLIHESGDYPKFLDKPVLSYFSGTHATGYALGRAADCINSYYEDSDKKNLLKAVSLLLEEYGR